MEKKGDLGTKRRPKGDPSPQFGLPLILYSLNSLNFSALLLVQCRGDMLIGGKMFLLWQPANLHGYIFPTLHPGPEMCKWVSNTHWVYERQKMQVVPNEPVISLGYLIIWIASHRKYLTQVCLKLMWWGWWKYIPKHFAFAISSAFAFWMKFVEKRGYLMMTDPLCSLLPLKMWLADYGRIVNAQIQ